MGTFSGIGGIGERRSLTYSVKQMLAREIEVEKMRQLEASLAQISAAGEPFRPPLNQDHKPKDRIEPVEVKETPVVPNHLQSLKPKAVTEVTKVGSFTLSRIPKHPRAS